VIRAFGYLSIERFSHLINWHSRWWWPQNKFSHLKAPIFTHNQLAFTQSNKYVRRTIKNKRVFTVDSYRWRKRMTKYLKSFIRNVFQMICYHLPRLKLMDCHWLPSICPIELCLRRSIMCVYDSWIGSSDIFSFICFFFYPCDLFSTTIICIPPIWVSDVSYEWFWHGYRIVMSTWNEWFLARDYSFAGDRIENALSQLFIAFGDLGFRFDISFKSYHSEFEMAMSDSRYNHLECQSALKSMCRSELWIWRNELHTFVQFVSPLKWCFQSLLSVWRSWESDYLVMHDRFFAFERFAETETIIMQFETEGYAFRIHSEDAQQQCTMHRTICDRMKNDLICVVLDSQSIESVSEIGIIVKEIVLSPLNNVILLIICEWRPLCKSCCPR
jgi:hypothetical protein